MDCWPLAKNLLNQLGICHGRDVGVRPLQFPSRSALHGTAFLGLSPMWTSVRGFKAGSDTDSGVMGLVPSSPCGNTLVTTLPPSGGRSN